MCSYYEIVPRQLSASSKSSKELQSNPYFQTRGPQFASETIQIAKDLYQAIDKAINMILSTPAGLAQAPTPFEFKSAAHLPFIEREQAINLEELSQSLRTCPDESIFQHTFRTLEEHHFIKEGFSNDFAQWAYTNLREVGLGERLAALERDRKRLVRDE